MKETIKVELTKEQANLIECYFILTARYRKKCAEDWLNLANDDNFKEIHEAAAGNAEFYEKLDGRLDEIVAAINKAYFGH